MLMNMRAIVDTSSADYKELLAKILSNSAILSKVNQADFLLAQLDKTIITLPSYELLLQPLMVREAVASSEIENLMTTTIEMLQAELAPFDSLTGIQKEVSRYKIALLAGYQTSRGGSKNETNITSQHIIDIQSTLLPAKPGLRTRPGIVIGNRLGEVVYKPPQEFAKINAELTDLCYFFSHSDIHPLLKIIFGHYQFEAIHPFYDGNGRTGRIIMALQFCIEHRLSFPVLFVSGYILEHKKTYYELFREIQQEQSYQNWVIFHLNGIIQQATETVFRVEELHQLIRRFRTKIAEGSLRRLHADSLSSVVTHYFFSRAFYTQTHLSQAINISRNTAKKYLESLREWGILQTRTAGKERLYFMPEFLDILH